MTKIIELVGQGRGGPNKNHNWQKLTFECLIGRLALSWLLGWSEATTVAAKRCSMKLFLTYELYLSTDQFYQ